MNGLLIRAPWIHHILAGEKTWEIRGTSSTIRGPIALIQSGTGCVSGFVELINVIGPLTFGDMLENCDRHRQPMSNMDFSMPYTKTYAWVLSNPQRLEKPIKYSHPNGAVIWVKLSSLILPTYDPQVDDGNKRPLTKNSFQQGCLWPELPSS